EVLCTWPGYGARNGRARAPAAGPGCGPPRACSPLRAPEGGYLAHRQSEEKRRRVTASPEVEVTLAGAESGGFRVELAQLRTGDRGRRKAPDVAVRDLGPVVVGVGDDGMERRGTLVSQVTERAEQGEPLAVVEIGGLLGAPGEVAQHVATFEHPPRPGTDSRRRHLGRRPGGAYELTGRLPDDFGGQARQGTENRQRIGERFALLVEQRAALAGLGMDAQR